MFTTIASAVIAAAGFTADRLTKRAAVKKLSSPRKYLDGRVELKLCTNSGFAMSRCENRRGLVLSVSVAAFLLCCALYAAVLAKPEYKTMRIAVGLIMAGAAGNVYDRVVKGRVVDFIHLSAIKKTVFNLADVFLVTGALLAIVAELTASK